MQEAYEVVQKLMDSSSEPEFEFGAIYVVKILELKESGAMVSLHPQLLPVFINNSHLDIRKVMYLVWSFHIWFTFKFLKRFPHFLLYFRLHILVPWVLKLDKKYQSNTLVVILGVDRFDCQGEPC